MSLFDRLFNWIDLVFFALQERIIGISVRLREMLQITKPWILLHFQRSSLMLKSDVLTLCHDFNHQFLFFQGILNDLNCNGSFLEILLISCFHLS